MIQEIATYIIIGIAGFYALLKAYQSLFPKKQIVGGCSSGGCSNCSFSKGCTLEEKSV